MSLYDYIYVDLEKIISLYSQLTGGVVELREENREGIRTTDNKRRYDFKVFKHDAGGTDQDISGMKEVIKPHHSLLTELEDELAKNGYLVDLTNPSRLQSFRNVDFRNQLKNSFCIKISGRAVVEDYERIKAIAQVFPEIVKLINKSSESKLRKSPSLLELQSQLEQIDREIKQDKNRNNRTLKEQQLKAIKKSVDDLLQSATKVNTVDQWVLDGLKTWIDAFLPGIVNLRIYPSIERPDEHAFGHLKRQCFEDSDSNSFHFTYGSLPTEELTMIGITTSVPMEGSDPFKPLAEFEKTELADYESVENAFRGMFRGFDGFEQMIRTSRYPRILVHPLMVYRSVAPNPSLQQA
jgi:hypothetical protein